MKNMIRNMRLSRKLSVAPATVAIFMVLLGIVAYGGLAKQNAALDDIFHNRFQRYQNSAVIVKDIASVHANIYKVISWANAKYEASKIDDLGKEQIEVLKRTGEIVQKSLQEKGITDEERKAYQEVSTNFAGYLESGSSAIDLASTDLNTATMFMDTADNKFKILYKSLQDLLQLEEKLSKSRYESSVRDYQYVIVIFGIVLITAFVLAIAVSILINRMIAHQIKETILITRKVAEGDLTGEIEVLSSDEIGQLAETMKNMVARLRSVIGETKSAANSVAAAGDHLSASSKQMSQGMLVQSGKASQIAAASEEMSQTILDMARNSAQMAGSASEAADMAKKGHDIVSRSVGEVNAIAQTVNESSGLMASLGERSRQIGDIVGAIKDIADQTNLLALNAAIEAARAGDQGRGFAVVADEVRKLAERTTKATSEIGEMIGAIQTEVERAVDSMADGTKRVESGVSFVGQAGDALGSIVGSIESLQTLVQQVASATEEMSTTAETISGDIASIADVAKQTSTESDQMVYSANDLTKLSSGLQGVVSQFKI
jgi:methyl-accepting chemotaxis protein